jgi:hypothetical protein
MDLTKRASGIEIAGFSRLLLLSCALIGSAALSAAPARAGLLNDMWGGDSTTAPPADDGKPKGLLNRMFGGDDPPPAQPPLASQSSAQPNPAGPATGAKRASGGANTVATPVEAAPAAQPSGEAIKLPGTEEPNALGRAMSSVGLTGDPAPTKIDYSERPKLVVPAQRDLPPPREGVERQPAARPEARTLVNPPPEYLQKMRGADGKVSGIKEGDVPKGKSFFGLLGGD